MLETVFSISSSAAGWYALKQLPDWAQGEPQDALPTTPKSFSLHYQVETLSKAEYQILQGVLTQIPHGKQAAKMTYYCSIHKLVTSQALAALLSSGSPGGKGKGAEGVRRGYSLGCIG